MTGIQLVESLPDRLRFEDVPAGEVQQAQLKARARQLRVERQCPCHRLDGVAGLTSGNKDGAAKVVRVAVLGITLDRTLQEFQGLFIPPAAYRLDRKLRELRCI